MDAQNNSIYLTLSLPLPELIDTKKRNDDSALMIKP